MKKLLSILLSLALLLSLGLPATAASDDLDKRMTAVTQTVKKTLSIDDDYDEFSGEMDDNTIHSYWSLSWSDDARQLNVTADDNGKVFRYSYSDGQDTVSRFWGFNAAFPKADDAEALKAAQAFADKLLGKNESVALEAYNSGSTDTLYYRGTLLLNGLPSPVSVRVRVRAADLTPTYFSRSDTYSNTLSTVPSAKSATSAAKAAELLKSTLKLTPYYVLNDDGKTASLRYVLETDGNYVVTAADGKLVNLDEIYTELVKSYNDSGYALAFGAAETAAASDASGSSSRLSETELKTIEGLKDVHSKEALDKAIRAVKQLGIDSRWTQESARYSQDRTTGDVTATLRYSRPLSAEEKAALDGDYGDELLQIYKTIVIDARTDELQSVYTANYYTSARRSAQTDEQRAAAESFLSEQLSDKWQKTARYDTGSDTQLGYAQMVNGYPFPANLLTVRMADDGTVDQLSVDWTDGVTFTSAEGIITSEDAVDACFNAHSMPLGYVEYPVLQDKLLVYKYVLAYTLDQPDDSYFGGIDAKTGEAIWTDYSSTAVYSYTDLNGCFGRDQIEALAAYGIGLAGDKFQPKATLDQKTMLALLLSACDYESDLTDEEALDSLYACAYNEGFLSAADRAPNAAVTRMTFIKTLLGASIYGEAAKVKGIYTCSFTDKAQIAEADLGYAALAAGLGIAQGDEFGKLNPNSTMTRQEAAVMLYNFMKR